MTNFETLTTYLRFPSGHWSRIRHSNFIDRTCLGLVWAVLDRASRGWRGVVMTPAAVRHLQELRHQLLDPPTTEEVTIETGQAGTAPRLAIGDTPYSAWPVASFLSAPLRAVARSLVDRSRRQGKLGREVNPQHRATGRLIRSR